MLLKCFSCGVEKDTNVLETYPWEEDGFCLDDPVMPLIVMECQSRENIWKAVVHCHSCHHKIQPDMWMSESEWSSLNPIIPFDKLPEVKINEMGYTDFNPESYFDCY